MSEQHVPESQASASTGPFAIEARKLRRQFGSMVAVDELDLRVPAGCFLGFLGANGAGKSTTIKMLTGLLPPTSGASQILGHSMGPDALQAKRAIGVVPEDLAIHDRLTGQEYLTFVGRMYGLQGSVIKERSAELLAWMSLDTEPRKLIIDYSHGMQKKLALAAALIHDPQVLFLDEPFEGIDVIASGEIRALLGKLVARGVTIFLTTHVLEIVEKLCSHVAIIHKGKLVAHGPLEELKRGVETDTGSTQTLEEIFFELVEVDRSVAPALSWLS